MIISKGLRPQPEQHADPNERVHTKRRHCPSLVLMFIACEPNFLSQKTWIQLFLDEMDKNWMSNGGFGLVGAAMRNKVKLCLNTGSHDCCGNYVCFAHSFCTCFCLLMFRRNLNMFFVVFWSVLLIWANQWFLIDCRVFSALRLPGEDAHVWHVCIKI